MCVYTRAGNKILVVLVYTSEAKSEVGNLAWLTY